MTARRLLPLLLALTACDDAGGGARPATDATGTDAAPADAAPADAAPADAAPDDAAPADASPDLPDAAPPAPEVFDVSGWRVEVTGAAWSVTPPGGDAPVLAAAADDALALTRGDARVQAAFGGFRIDLVDLEDLTPVGPPAVSADPLGVSLRFDLAEGAATLRFEDYADGALWIGLEAEGLPPEVGGRLSFACGPDDGFFGLGTQVTGLDLRGRRYPLWTQEQGITKPESGQPFPVANIPEAAYAPMGIWHGSAGFSAIIGHEGFSALDLCGAQPDRWTLESHRALPSFVLVPGATPKDRLSAVTALVGRPTVPPPWAFAPWNDAVGGPARLRAVAEALRAADVPSSAIWSEDWIGGTQSDAGYRLSYAWEWDPATYPDLPDDVAWLHARGFAFLAYFNPFVPMPTRMWQEGVDGGWLVKDAAGAVISFLDPAFRDAGLVDLTDAAARDWFAGYARTAAADLGIDGWMADFAEWLPIEARMADGRDGWAAHNPYPLAWQALNREVMEAVHANDPRGADDWIFFARSGFASIHGATSGLAPALWAGDQNTDWDRDDGLPTVIPIGAHVGLAGVAHFGSDIAGYTSVLNPNTDKELFLRWASLGALTPLMRTHHGSDECGNWTFDRDAESLAHFRRWARVHTLLYPVLRGLAEEAAATGIPPVRHPWLVYPDRPDLWRDQGDFSFLGDALLVAPVVEAGATGRPVRLPAPGWWPLFGAAPLADAELQADAPATELPVFVAPGTLLPLLGDVVDSFYGSEDPEITDLSAVAGWHRLALYPAADGAVAGRLGGEAIAGAGFTAHPDWTQARLDDAALPACGDPPCATPTGVRVVGPGVLTIGAARLPLPAGRFDVAWAGEAFGADAAPTPLTELSPDIPPPCE
ncbi:MAG: glycoside hydrolase family 31 protein [bacterium]